MKPHMDYSNLRPKVVAQLRPSMPNPAYCRPSRADGRDIGGHDGDEYDAKEKARLLLGIPRPNADAVVAINCAWDMGYRRPDSLAEMARQMLVPPTETVKS